ncbi:MAG: hypothetical protein IJK89_11135 [Clostridia bacterium]|nr:hypothetical protein [Clostridia bacterium]
MAQTKALCAAARPLFAAFGVRDGCGVTETRQKNREIYKIALFKKMSVLYLQK